MTRRSFRAKHSVEAQQDFLRDFGIFPSMERSAVDRLAAISRGEDDPGPGPTASSVEEEIIAGAAGLMKAEIDKEIKRAQMSAVDRLGFLSEGCP